MFTLVVGELLLLLLKSEYELGDDFSGFLSITTQSDDEATVVDEKEVDGFTFFKNCFHHSGVIGFIYNKKFLFWKSKV